MINDMQDKAFSSVDCVGQCLIDEPRTKAFEKAINKIVKPQHNVLDIGTGSGIMALFAAKAGAKEVRAIEFDPCVADIARDNFINNGYKDKIQLIVDDARTLKFDKNIRKFDVVIMEMLTTGMIDEFQIQAVNNLYKQRVVDSSTIFIPTVQETYVCLGEMDFEIYHLQMKMVKHLWNGLSKNQKYIAKSQRKLLSSISFNKKNEERFSNIVSLKILKSGKVNCIYLSSATFLTDKIVIKDTETLNAPVVVPIKERSVKTGEELRLKIGYVFGKGFQNFIAEII